jgi:hypothetical protein
MTLHELQQILGREIEVTMHTGHVHYGTLTSIEDTHIVVEDAKTNIDRGFKQSWELEYDRMKALWVIPTNMPIGGELFQSFISVRNNGGATNN